MTQSLTPEASAFIEKLTQELGGVDKVDLIAKAPNCDLVLEWLGYLYHNKLTGVCDHFLDGLRSLILESLVCSACSLKRSSLLSMRGQIDMALSWLYYKDHPREWDRVERENEGYKLKTEVLKFLESYIVNFKSAIDILSLKSSRITSDPYKVLSSHIHSMGLNVIPNIKNFVDIIDSDSKSELYTLQNDVSEYISDLYMAYFASDWASLPQGIVEKYQARLGQENFAKVAGK